MLNATLSKFGYPESLIKTYDYWHVLLRPGQVTIGSLVLICKEDVYQYADISEEAAREQKQVIADIERILKKRFNFSKINYLMLMMVDPAVHFHVIPRYDSPVTFCEKQFEDTSWPSPPNLKSVLPLDDIYRDELLSTLKGQNMQIVLHQTQHQIGDFKQIFQDLKQKSKHKFQF